MKKTLLPFVLLVLFVTACTECDYGDKFDDLDLLPCRINTNFSKPIRPGDLQLGQRSRFLLLRGNGYGSASGLDFEYLPDTLIVEVFAQKGDTFSLREFFTCGSQELADKPGFVVYADSFATVQVRVANDSFYILPSIASCCNDSRLFFNHATALPLAHTLNPEVQITGWKTTLPYHESNIMAFILNTELLGKNWPFLNVASLNAGMQVDGPGFTFLYDREYGIARTAYYSWWTQAGYGFDYME